MSIVKEKLKQEKDEFISLREAVELLFQYDGGCTLREAAEYLAMSLKDPKSPTWVCIRYGGFVTADPIYAERALTGVEELGNFERWESDCIEYGFKRIALFEFLACGGIYLGNVSPLQPPDDVGLMHSSEAAGDSRELLLRLQDSERERLKLQQEVGKLQAQAQEASSRDGKLGEQAAQIGKLQADFGLAQDEIERLKTEMVQGKSLAALQKMVVGMAVDSYGYNPNEAKSPVTTQIVNDLAKKEISIDPDTVRKHLKRAADAHLPGR